MQGFSGPIPNRSDERVRRNKDGTEIETVTAFGYVEKPPLGIPNAHPLVTSAYESLNEMLWQNRLSAQLLMAVNTMLANLMMTEGDRRRLRIEIQRKENNPGAQGSVTSIEDVYRERLNQTRSVQEG